MFLFSLVFRKSELTDSFAILFESSFLKIFVIISFVKTDESNPCLSKLITSSVSFEAIKEGGICVRMIFPRKLRNNLSRKSFRLIFRLFDTFYLIVLLFRSMIWELSQ